MGRPKKQTEIIDVPAINEEAVRRDIVAAEQVAMIQTIQNSALEVGRALGAIQTSELYATVAESVRVQTFIQLREGKKYKDLVIKGPDGNIRQVQTIEEACEHLLGRSYRSLHEAAQNFELLGNNLYDKAEQLGLTTKDKRALRALPSDEQTIVIEAIKAAQDRDDVIDLIQAMAEKHAKEKAELQATNDAQASIIQTKQQTINEKNDELDGLKEKKREAPEWQQKVEGWVSHMGEVFALAYRATGSMIVFENETLEGNFSDNPEEQERAMRILSKTFGDHLHRHLEELSAIQRRFDMSAMRVYWEDGQGLAPEFPAAPGAAED